MCSSGVEALLTATQGVVGGMPESMRLGGEGGGSRGRACRGRGWRRRGRLRTTGGELDFAGGVVGGGEDELGGGGAVGERGLQGGGYGEGGGDAGDDLEGDVVLAEEGYLFAGAAEDEGVAGFEAEDGAVVSSEACSSIRAWMPAWVMRGWPQRLPTGMMRAVGLARSRMSSETRSSGRMTSQVFRSSAARRVRRRGRRGLLLRGRPFRVGLRWSLLTIFLCDGVGFGVFAGEGAGGAAVVAADFAGGELVEQEAAGFVEGLGGYYFAAEVAEVGEPVAGVEGELVVDLLAEALGEGG